jgi:predicted membrane channel-forming protein YqfA (hemolysin III family)
VGCWHLPVLLAAEDAEHGLAAWGVLALVALTLASIVGYAFAYTFLVNKTGSVLLAIAMHASFNVANGFAGLRTDEALRKTDYLLILGLSAATIWALVAVLVAVTHGRLGSGASAVVGRRPKPSAPRRVVPA